MTYPITQRNTQTPRQRRKARRTNVAGRLSRRSFVRGLVALGYSLPVAIALADRYADGRER